MPYIDTSSSFFFFLLLNDLRSISCRLCIAFEPFSWSVSKQQMSNPAHATPQKRESTIYAFVCTYISSLCDTGLLLYREIILLGQTSGLYYSRAWLLLHVHRLHLHHHSLDETLRTGDAEVVHSRPVSARLGSSSAATTTTGLWLTFTVRLLEECYHRLPIAA